MDGTTKILIVENNDVDIELIQYELKSGGINYIAEVVKNEPDYINALKLFSPHIILSDYVLPSFGGNAAFEIRKQLVPETPFIFISGTIGEERSVEYIKNGLTDYVLKDKLISLSVKVKRALEDLKERQQTKIAEEALKKSEKFFRALIENSKDMITLRDQQGGLIYGSPFISVALGYSPEEMATTRLYDVIHPEDLPLLRENMDQLLNNPGGSFNFQHRRQHKNGSWVWCEGTVTNLLNDPAVGAMLTNFRDISAKKALEHQQEFDRNNLEALINNTNDLLWSIDTDCNLITANQPFDEMMERVFGRKILKGESALNVGYPKKILSSFKKYYDRALTGEIFTDIKYGAAPFNTCIEISFHPIRSEGKLMGAACQLRDITEKIKAERQVALNERRFRALVENGAEAVAILTADGNFTYISPSIQQILGYTVAESANINLFSLVHPNDLAILQKGWQQFVGSFDSPLTGLTYRMRHKGGTWRWVEGTLTNLLLDPSINGIVDNFRDITEKKLAEENLLLTQLTIDNADDAVYWMEADARIIKVNKAACLMLGYTMEELTSFSIPDIDPFFNADKWHGHYAEMQVKGSLFFETVQQTKDGRLIPVEIKANYFKFGETQFNCAIVRDISERKHAETEREKLVKNLTLRNSELEQFAYVASHDLQEPLRMITSFLTNLEIKYGTVLDDKGRKYIHFAVDGAKRMRQIILDLLDYSRVGKTEEELEEVDFNILIKEILALYRKRIEDSGAQILFNNLPTFRTYKTPLRQVFQNLVSNGLKYQKAGNAPVISITCTQTKDLYQFAVKDNGIGIAPEYLERIFIIFQRLHNKDEYSGNGMGLAMVKKIAESMGGKTWAESTEGQGSTFYFTILKHAIDETD